MSCEIFQFSAASRPARTVSEKPSPAEVTAICERINRTLTPRELRRAGKPPLPPPLTETCKNARIRIKRRDVWWHADRVASYWRARMDWQAALECAQDHGIADSASFPPARANESRFDLVDKWREAVARQMLTPAPDLSAVTWKRAKLKTVEFNYLPITAVRAEQVIADDVAFLVAHPTRRGRIFEKDPITLGPKTTAAELAAVVRTLPEAEQQMVDAMVDQLLQERDQ